MLLCRCCAMLYIIFIPQTLKWCPFLTLLACNNHSNDIVASTLEITHHSICTHLLISIHNSAYTPPFAYKPHYIQPKFLQRYFYLAHRPPKHVWPASKLLYSKVSMVEWQRKNEASVHRTAKEFAINRKRVLECRCQCYSALKGQTRGVLGKRRRLRCGQPLAVDLDHKVFEFLEDERREGRPVSNQLLSNV